MQVLKEEVRQRIIKSAKKEFKNNGFDKASMRDIADSAKMTVGNLYRYYKNKEDMFGAIIGDLYGEIKDLRSSLPEGEVKVSLLLNRLVELQRANKAEWLILFNTTKGSKYGRAVEDIYNLLTEALVEQFAEKREGFDETIAKPVAYAIINGLNTILQNERKYSSDATEHFLEYMIKTA
ncbi:MAG: TetR/AcrR family transcriptional regulator [Spirochaetales bacterium]|nr:TetR/AcrR family transcriptional regulator [Spirochaetales bacterium]